MTLEKHSSHPISEVSTWKMSADLFPCTSQPLNDGPHFGFILENALLTDNTAEKCYMMDIIYISYNELSKLVPENVINLGRLGTRMGHWPSHIAWPAIHNVQKWYARQSSVHCISSTITASSEVEFSDYMSQSQWVWSWWDPGQYFDWDLDQTFTVNTWNAFGWRKKKQWHGGSAIAPFKGSWYSMYSVMILFSASNKAYPQDWGQVVFDNKSITQLKGWWEGRIFDLTLFKKNVR